MKSNRFIALTLLGLVCTWPLTAQVEEASPTLLEHCPWENGLAVVDQIDLTSWVNASQRQLDVWKNISTKKKQQPLATLGARQVSIQDLELALQEMLHLRRTITNPLHLQHAIAERFSCFQMAGKTGQGDVLMTAYYHPVYPGSLTPSNHYPVPLHRRPDDLVLIDTGKKKIPVRKVADKNYQDKWVAYYNHEEISEHAAFAKNSADLAYVSSELDRFFLQVQGSGSIQLPNGKLFPVFYAASNGQPYVGIGQLLVADGLLGSNELSMQSIRELLDYDEDLKKTYLYKNPSYVFFRKGEGLPQGSTAVELTPGRSFASDKKLFPGGLLAWVQFYKPTFSDGESITAWVSSGGLMLDQDTGGAIKGPGRVDLYLGSGAWAEQTAGRYAFYGQVYYLLLKS